MQARARGDARLDAETLMMHVLGRNKAYLYAHPEVELACGELNRYQEALQRRAAGEPLQYITGHQEFWGLDLLVTPAVLVPRRETEHAVEAALELLREIKSPRVIDVGTGSGCIALALASELPGASLNAVDISNDALEVARKNAKRLNLLDRVAFSQSDLLGSYLNGALAFDMVVSNPPYVGDSEADKLQVEVREHEPHQALFGGGVEGLDIYRRLIPQAARVLKPGGWLVMEIGYTQEQAIRDLLKDWKDVRCVPDLRGIPRVVIAKVS
ncbi:MAG: peptide chain release factor N(5)-glutamine methyltransferase [Acidobacteria bacterium]|nr:MAG: peptide chain release factor N(5)-glutamine methyltransferase [Acidobacteriota bacterium]PYY23771.1 MAG: peptide chain release factor N(5)-glutamine methyltransferase [Acidobacteriota bacterium]